MAPKEDLSLQLDVMEKKIVFIEGNVRKRSAALLFIGACFGLFGFFFAFITGFIKFAQASEEYPSGNGYFPSTVSEMVSNPRDPAGKAFFAFEFISAVFIFLSWYPWELRNVYMGDDDMPCCGVSWTMFRQFLPAPGMMLVATVTTTPIQIATVRDQFTIFIHLSGAMMMFMGFMFIEMKTLGWKMKPPMNPPVIGEKERKYRMFFVWGILLNYTGFISIQVLLGIPHINQILCCQDTFVKVQTLPGYTLVDTAHSYFFIFKLLSYISEVICGFSLICSHLTIWYFCNERTIDLDDELTAAGTQDKTK